MSYYLMLLVGAVLVNNFVLSRFLGCCPFLGVSKKLDTPLEKQMATHSSILAWEILWTEEPGGLPSTGSHRVGHD